MIKYDITDTIAAISTPIGESGIGIVRVSGKGALKIADKIFVSKDSKRPSDFKSYTTHYGWVRDRRQEREERRQDIIDEVILTVMCAPKSYTKEDIVEINCHGGIIALRRVLDLILGNGCRLAEPGEFTKRAFLNGRIDLAQAEAVLDIIRAKTDAALKVGAEQLKGALSGEIIQIRKIMLDILSILEANIDFPEEQTSALDLGSIRQNLQKVNQELSLLLDGARYGRIVREGINVVICGKPNVGKSSLLNALLKQERSIVSPIAGTTRDTIEENIDIKGIPIRITDTAGIIEPRGLIEKKAVWRSKKYIDLSDLVILLFDGSRKLSRQDHALVNRLKKKTVIAVVNKIDLRQKIDKSRISARFRHIVDISAKKVKNINLLEEAVANLVYDGKVKSPEPVLISNLRHIEALRKAQKLIVQALDSLDNKLSLEFIAQYIKEALGHFDDILGRRFSEDLLDKIFSEFCIGK
jgi:tRNA modification GTPase